MLDVLHAGSLLASINSLPQTCDFCVLFRSAVNIHVCCSPEYSRVTRPRIFPGTECIQYKRTLCTHWGSSFTGDRHVNCSIYRVCDSLNCWRFAPSFRWLESVGYALEWQVRVPAEIIIIVATVVTSFAISHTAVFETPSTLAAWRNLGRVVIWSSDNDDLTTWQIDSRPGRLIVEYIKHVAVSVPVLVWVQHQRRNLFFRCRIARHRHCNVGQNDGTLSRRRYYRTEK